MLTMIALSLACAPSGGVPAGEQPPDFTLVDVNTASATYLQEVSPRDKLDQASAWYFGHST